MHLRNLVSSLDPVAFSLLLNCWLYTNLRFVLLCSTVPMFGVVLPNLLYVLLTSPVQTSPNLSNLPLIVVWLQICSFSIDLLWTFFIKNQIKDIIPDPLRHALLNHTLPSHLVHELFPTNLLSFQEPVYFGTPYLPLPFLNPTTYLASKPTSTNLISSPYLFNFSFSFFLCQGFVKGSMAFPWHYLLKSKIWQST